jgi:hypothetical protein
MLSDTAILVIAHRSSPVADVADSINNDDDDTREDPARRKARSVILEAYRVCFPLVSIGKNIMLTKAAMIKPPEA